jgi:RNA polymerase sigma-70 factor (ECF subfamily)
VSQRRPPFAEKSASRRLALVRPPALAPDAELVTGVMKRDPAAIEAFYDRHAGHVRRVLARILGAERELGDLEHDVFLRALASLDTLKDPSSLKPWLAGIAVFAAKSLIQRRTRGRWLHFLAPDEVPEVEAGHASEEVNEAVRATYSVLDRLPVDERIAFALRVIDGMELTEVASACGVSLSTIKRRVARAEARFVAMARSHPALVDWVEGGTRWGAAADPSKSSAG